MNSKKIILPIIATAVIGTGIFISVKNAKADVVNSPLSGFVQAISQKFGLNETDVQTFVDDYHKQKRDEMQIQALDRETTYLSGLVSEGKISEEQKQAILQKQEELRNKYSSDNSTQTPEERRQEMEAKRSELETWANSEGLDPSYVMMGFGGHGMRGPGGFGRFDD